MSQQATTAKRDGFSSRFGVIAAAAGSAVGLGNIWRKRWISLYFSLFNFNFSSRDSRFIG